MTDFNNPENSENDDFDPITELGYKLDDIRGEIMLQAYCNIAAACTVTTLIEDLDSEGNPVREVKVDYNREKHQKLFTIISSDFDELIKSMNVQGEINNMTGPDSE